MLRSLPFPTLQKLKYHTQILVKRKGKKKGKKISGIIPVPGENKVRKTLNLDNAWNAGPWTSPTVRWAPGNCVFYGSAVTLLQNERACVFCRGVFSLRPVDRASVLTSPPWATPPQILVSSNDSRIRLYDLTDFSLSRKFRGAVNTRSQIRATIR